MRNFAVLGPPVAEAESIAEVELSQVRIQCGVVRTTPPVFDAADARFADSVLVRKKAFSLNYRDRRLMLQAALAVTPGQFYVIGSEFAGEVVAVGDNVQGFSPGDRVVGDGSYPGAEGVRGGLPTNNGSKELQVLPRNKLAKIPASMSDAVASSFAIGAQTVYSMIRRLDLHPGARVLVTAARSNTSLFALNALKARDVRVYAGTTSTSSAAAIAKLGVHEVLRLAGPESATVRDAADAAREIGGFDAVIDPFSDLYLANVISWMAFGGRYVTCGVFDQTRGLLSAAENPSNSSGIDLAAIIVKNLSIMGNCLGSTEDLQAALDDFALGRLAVIVDSVFGRGEERAFLERTFRDPDRFGKVVYHYD